MLEDWKGPVCAQTPVLVHMWRTLFANFALIVAVLGAQGLRGLWGEAGAASDWFWPVLGRFWLGRGRAQPSPSALLVVPWRIWGKKGERCWKKGRNEEKKCEEELYKHGGGRRRRGAPGARAEAPLLPLFQHGVFVGCGMDVSRRNLHSPAPLKVGEGVGNGVSWILQKGMGGRYFNFFLYLAVISFNWQ